MIDQTSDIKRTFKSEVRSKLVQCPHLPLSGLLYDHGVQFTHDRRCAIRSRSTSLGFCSSQQDVCQVVVTESTIRSAIECLDDDVPILVLATNNALASGRPSQRELWIHGMVGGTRRDLSACRTVQSCIFVSDIWSKLVFHPFRVLLIHQGRPLQTMNIVEKQVPSK